MTTDTLTATKPDALPQAKGSLVPYLIVGDAAEVSAFYQRAFGARVVSRVPAPDGKSIIHLHLYINGQSLMLTDPMPDHGRPLQAPQGYTLMLIVDDIDTAFKRAADAGCTVVTPVDRMFWGDRFGALTDPFGVEWAMNEPAKA